MALVLLPAVRRAGLRYRPRLELAPPGRAPAARAVGLDARLRRRQPGRRSSSCATSPTRAPATPPPTSTRSRSSCSPTGCWRCRSPRRSCPEMARVGRPGGTAPAFMRPGVARRAADRPAHAAGRRAAVRAAAGDRRRLPRSTASTPPADADNTARALGGFALGLVGFSVYLFVLRGFYAHQDTRTPFVINVVQNVLNIVLAFVLVGRYGVARPRPRRWRSPTSSCALWALQVLSYKVPGLPAARPCWPASWRMVVAGALAGEAMWLVARQVGGDAGGAARACAWSSPALVGLAVYVGVLVALRAPELTARCAPGCPAALRRTVRLGSRACSSCSRSGGSTSPPSSPGTFNERADPKVQLEQAIAEAQNQHRRLQEQAANVIANQKQGEMRLNAQDGRAGEAQRQRPPGADHGRRRREGRRRRRRRRSTPPPPRRSPTS